MNNDMYTAGPVWTAPESWNPAHKRDNLLNVLRAVFIAGLLLLSVISWVSDLQEIAR